MTKVTSRIFRASGFVIPSTFGIRASTFSARCAFTVLELLVVISIVIALAGLILATTGYVQKKGARSRAEAEIAAMSAALESYKADNGNYPSDASTIALTPTNTDPATYQAASSSLYKLISGDADGDRTVEQKSYLAFKSNMLLPAPPSTAAVVAIRDPFGNSYGYSTAKNPEANPNAATATGYNPTYDLWSTGGGTRATDLPQWIKNW